MKKSHFFVLSALNSIFEHEYNTGNSVQLVWWVYSVGDNFQRYFSYIVGVSLFFFFCVYTFSLFATGRWLFLGTPVKSIYTNKQIIFGIGLKNCNCRCMNMYAFLVVESRPGRVHGGNSVLRELTPEQKTSAKFAINIQFEK